MLKVLRKLLLSLIDNIDSGNSNIDEEDQKLLINILTKINDTRMSKVQACKYLNMSRATFDNLVRDNKLPKGIKEVGFKELSWRKKELDEYVAKFK